MIGHVVVAQGEVAYPGTEQGANQTTILTQARPGLVQWPWVRYRRLDRSL